MNSTLNFPFVILLALSSLSLSALAGSPPPRSVVLSCSPLPYSFSCAIPRTANPSFDANCWYRANGTSYLMRKDGRFGFYNDIVRLKIEDSSPARGFVTEARSGRGARCHQGRMSVMTPDGFEDWSTDGAESDDDFELLEDFSQ